MKKESKIGAGIALGCAVGAVIGMATDNQGLWIAVGIAIGAGIGTRMTKKALLNPKIIENTTLDDFKK